MTHAEETLALTAEDAAAMIDAEIAQRDDPEGFAKAQALAAIDAQYAPILDIADDATRSKAENLIAGKKREIEQQYAPVGDTTSALDLPPVDKGKAVWSATQHVEPERDGKPWCTWEDAERMLKLSALSASRGAKGVKAGGYRFVRDEEAMTLTLELV